MPSVSADGRRIDARKRENTPPNQHSQAPNLEGWLSSEDRDRSAGRIFKAAKVWSRPVVLGVGSGAVFGCSVRVPAGDIYPADMVGGSLGSLSLLSGTRGAVRRRGLAF